MGKLMTYPLQPGIEPKLGPKNKQGGMVASLMALRDRLERELDSFDTDTGKEIHYALDQAMLQGMGVEKMLFQQERRLTEMENLTITDELTGVMNRRGFERELKRVLATAHRYEETGILVYVDLDDFKPINDTFGHAAGDAVLRKVAELLKANTRAHDTVGRLGGDEFSVILARTDWEKGLVRAEMLGRIVNEAMVQWNHCPITIRASLGLQSYDGSETAADLIHHADQAMYEVKRERSATDRAQARKLKKAQA